MLGMSITNVNTSVVEIVFVKSYYLLIKFPKLLSNSLLFFRTKSSQLKVLSCNKYMYNSSWDLH